MIKTNQLLLFIIVLSGVTLFSYFTWTINKELSCGIDDANIYFVYMKNLSSGEGFVYNAGERVEGFTSMLWVFIGSFIMLFTSHPEKSLIILNALMISGSLFYLLKYLHERLQLKYVISFPLIFIIGMLGIIPGFFDWTIVSLLETGLWSSLLIISAVSLLYITGSFNAKIHRVIFYSSLFLLTFTRPEALLWSVLIIISYVIILVQAKNKPKDIGKKILLPFAIFLVSNLMLVVFRLYYFGYPLPNTYYAKVSSDTSSNINDGMKYLSTFFSDSNPVLPLVIASAFIFTTYQSIKSKKWVFRNYVLLFLSLTFVMVALYSGGDHFDLGRFIQPFTPLVYASLVFCFPVKWQKSMVTPVVSAVFIVLLVSVDLLPITIRNAYDKKKFDDLIINEFTIARDSRKFYTELNDYFDQLPEYPRLGVLTAGASKYTYKGYVYDMLGLNNVKMAHADQVKEKNIFKNHASFNKEVFYQQHPDIFFMDIVPLFYPRNTLKGNFNYKISKFSLEVFKNIPYDSTFQKTYRLTLIQKKGEDDFLATFASADWLAKIDTSKYQLTF